MQPFGNVIVPVIVKLLLLKLVAVKLLTDIELEETLPSLIVVPFPSVIVTIPFRL
jgi:tellurite resistance protein TehA-like permease